MVVILGSGESGYGAAMLARKRGINVFVSDSQEIKPKVKYDFIENEIDFESNGHNLIYDMSPDYIIKSPGIPDTSDVIQFFKKINVPIISEIEFAYQHCQGRIIGITGSNGKTTTTNLIYHFLQENNFDVIKAGNVGYSFSAAVEEKDYDWYVVELSSFQLDNMYDFKPDIAVLLNITPDHLDRYEYNFNNYIKSKLRITEKQNPDDVLIYNAMDPAIAENIDSKNSKAKLIAVMATLEDQYKVMDKNECIADLQFTVLQGKHNALNVACAVRAAQAAGLSLEQIQSTLPAFINDPHRMELVREVNGVKYINDSKATNVDSVFYALDAISENIIWIAGGTDKGNDYSSLLPLAEQKVKALIALGVDNKKIVSNFANKIDKIIEVKTMNDAIYQAGLIAKAGDVVLLSPACASFDLFKNYEDRGNQFKLEVLKLKV